jgi:methylthioribose-1-phosphate isomerase
MNIRGEHFRTIWVKDGEPEVIQVIDQQQLPHDFVVMDMRSVEDVRRIIKDMHVRGAGLIGATAGYGMYLAALEARGGDFDAAVQKSAEILVATRPTASNLEWAVKRQLAAMQDVKTADEKVEIAFRTAGDIADEDAEFCRRIGEHGLKIIREISERKNGEPVNILTHCNAGWLAFVDYGSATAPIYAAQAAGIPVHVWVDETRPRNQGAALTAWEMDQQGVDHHLIVDNAGGHLMQHGMVDMVIVGTDRTTRCGDVANKIGTYLKALAAKDNDVPFYVALPSSTFDFEMRDGVAEIPIEERDAAEVRVINNQLICPEGSPAKNYGFDVTPARLVTGLICERGICEASEEGILQLFPEQADEGYVKFRAHLTEEDLPDSIELRLLNETRTELHELELIGVLPNGIGYGNLSVRPAGDETFLISGTATGAERELPMESYCRVDSFNAKTNEVWCTGRVKASSETMSHGAVYQANDAVRCVIHIHNRELFDFMLAGHFAKTPKEVAFGTPELAEEIRTLVEAAGEAQGVFVLAGHQDGVMAYGPDIESARDVLLGLYQAVFFS